jgi:hypothetical protein
MLVALLTISFSFLMCDTRFEKAALPHPSRSSQGGCCRHSESVGTIPNRLCHPEFRGRVRRVLGETLNSTLTFNTKDIICHGKALLEVWDRTHR